MRDIDIHDYYEGDWCVAVQCCLDDVGRKDACINFGAGVYDFFPEKAVQKFTYIANHCGDGYRPFAFPFFDCKNIVLKGKVGTKFMLNGCMVPFGIISCDGIKIENIRIDWAVPLYSQGVVLKVEDECFDMEIGSEYQAEVRDQRLYLRQQHFWGAVEMDAEEGYPKSGRGLNFMEDYPDRLKFEALTDKCFRVHGKLQQPPEVGCILILRHGKRNTPAIFIDNSANIDLVAINIHQAGGMGIIAQNSRDININEFSVTPNPESKRLFSICADAVHMVSCSGDIEIDDCVFENQLDDAINIHGVYLQVCEWISSSEVKVRFGHHAQKGLVVGEPGNNILFSEQDTLRPVFQEKIKRVSSVDSEYSIIELDGDTAVYGQEDLVVENIDWQPENLTITNCVARRSNPRGFLISAGKNVLIENNYINVPQAAIFIAGGVDSWFEAGAVDSVIIRNNTFENCNNKQSGSSKAVIDVRPQIARLCEDYYYHGNILIEDNTFEKCYCRLVFAQSTEEFKFSNNCISNPIFGSASKEYFTLRNLGNVCLDNTSR